MNDYKTYRGKLTSLPDNGIFVFGSNTQGRHSKGAAHVASVYFGAIYGQPKGLQGKSYAIVTKDLTKNNDGHPTVGMNEIADQIKELYNFARENPQLDFYVAYAANTELLSHYTWRGMSILFSCETPPTNIIFEEAFGKQVMEDTTKNWEYEGL